jgi:hypothetical protein
MDAISLPRRKEMAKEKTLKGLMPLRNPQNLFLLLSFGGYQKALSHLQVLRQRIKDPLPIASRLSSSTSFRAALQGRRREKHKSLFCISRRFVITRGGRRKQERFCLKFSLTEGRRR